MKIWTWTNTPFRLGGSYSPMATDAGEPRMTQTVAGYTLCTFQNPVTGKWHVAEQLSGGLVGHGSTQEVALLETVNDILQGDPDVMEEQVRQAIVEGNRAQMVDSAEFWSKFSRR